MALCPHRKYRLSQLRQRNNERSPAYLSGLDIQILKFLPRQAYLCCAKLRCFVK